MQDMGRSTEALVAFDRAVRLQPDAAVPRCNRGDTLVAMGRLDDAVTATAAVEAQSYIDQGLNGAALGEAIRRARMQSIAAVPKPAAV